MEKEFSTAEGVGGNARGARTEKFERSTSALVLYPYYLSSWGKKKMLGKKVEEGEGLGPRRELFELAAAQLSQRSRPQSSR